VNAEALLVLTTCGDAREAAVLADTLVEKRLAACVTRLEGIVSTYRWESALQHDKEVLVLIKTTEERFKDVETSIRELANYELPEVLAVPIHSGSADYLQWLAASVSLED
jgi:periplasmic divalent cation tolerance protein